ncbi:MAG: hypothetical protein FWF78_10460 [Defluviitaleaceae bacterium]|nr:hypothetical protein [Defluviitaleaceae bacterium]
MHFEYDYFVTAKLSEWARRLPDDCDFLDYWFNFFMSDIKRGIDDKGLDNSTSFWLTRWRYDFEKEYSPIHGEGYFDYERAWFAMYTQYLVYELQTPSRLLANHYEIKVFKWLLERYQQYHTIGVNLFIDYFTEEWGFPPNVTKPARIVNC